MYTQCVEALASTCDLIFFVHALWDVQWHQHGPIFAYYQAFRVVGTYVYCNATCGSRYPPTVNDCTPAPPPFESVHNYDRRERTRASRCSSWSTFHSRHCLTAIANLVFIAVIGMSSRVVVFREVISLGEIHSPQASFSIEAGSWHLTTDG